MSFPRPRSIAANAIDSQQSHDNVELRSMAEKANAYRYYTLKDVWNAMKYEKKINFYFWMSILLDIIGDWVMKQFGYLLVGVASLLISGIALGGFLVTVPTVSAPMSLLRMFHYLWGGFMVCSIAFNYFKAVTTKPGAPADIFLAVDAIDRSCKKCNFAKPRRTHHCSICRSCVLKMDHHCPWVNNCVGHYNYRYFVSFLIWVTLGTLYLAGISASHIVRSNILQHPGHKGHMRDATDHQNSHHVGIDRTRSQRVSQVYENIYKGVLEAQEHSGQRGHAKGGKGGDRGDGGGVGSGVSNVIAARRSLRNQGLAESSVERISSNNDAAYITPFPAGTEESNTTYFSGTIRKLSSSFEDGISAPGHESSINSGYVVSMSQQAFSFIWGYIYRTYTNGVMLAAVIVDKLIGETALADAQLPSDDFIILLLAILSVGVGIGTGILMSLHLYLIAYGLTTIEMFETRYLTEKLKKQGVKYKNPNDHGIVENFKDVFGPYPWHIALLPSSRVPTGSPTGLKFVVDSSHRMQHVV